MSETFGSKGIRFLKVLGLVAFIGALVAVGRILFRVFNEESAGSDSESHGA